MNVAEVWVNGVKKITHLGGYLPFVVDFTNEANVGSENEVLVKLDNRDNPVTGTKPLNQLDFNFYGGLYRDVFFIVKNRLHITDPVFENKPAAGGIFVTYPEVSEKFARIRVQTHIRNDFANEKSIHVNHELFFNDSLYLSYKSREEKIEGSDEMIFTADLDVNFPKLWSVEAPNLYTLVTSLVSERKIVDSDTTQIGIRRFEITPDKFTLNGHEIFLRGVNRHQEYPYIGYVLSNEAQYREAVRIKEAGFDYVRLSHYPHSPAFMNACDELGLLVIDAIPGWQYFSNDSAFQNQVISTCRDMIRRDRNHACVLAWEVSLNESWMPEPFIDRAVAAAHEEYPGKQCFTAGWQTHGYDIYLQARQHRLQHYTEPDKPYIVSEYGDWEYYAMNAGFNQDSWENLKPEARSSRQLLSGGEKRLLQQTLNIQEAHNDNLNAEVYTGTPQWEKAQAACDTIINSGNFALEADFFNNFVANATASSEHILGVPFDRIYALGFEVHLFTLHYNLQEKYGLASGPWNGICAQEALFNSFDTNDVRRNGLLSGKQYDAEGNQIQDPGYEKFPNIPFDPDGIGLNLTPNINMLEPSCLRQCGTRVSKFPFIEGSDRYISNDFPIFRYADVLLMKAECLLNSGGDLGEALNLVNQVRSRAGVDALTELTAENLLAERGRELFAEGHRRSDMIRFGTYLDARWEKPDVTSEYRTLWPIPESQIQANPNLVQNPGY